MLVKRLKKGLVHGLYFEKHSNGELVVVIWGYTTPLSLVHIFSCDYRRALRPGPLYWTWSMRSLCLVSSHGVIVTLVNSCMAGIVPGERLSLLNHWPKFTLIITLKGTYHYYPHFTVDKLRHRKSSQLPLFALLRPWSAVTLLLMVTELEQLPPKCHTGLHLRSCPLLRIEVQVYWWNARLED